METRSELTNKKTPTKSRHDSTLAVTPAKPTHPELRLNPDKASSKPTLPSHYASLLSQFRRIEESFSLFHGRKIIPKFSEVKSSVETSSNHRFTLKRLYQILSLGKFYHVDFHDRSQDDPLVYQLNVSDGSRYMKRLDSPTSLLRERLFHDILLQRVSEARVGHTGSIFDLESDCPVIEPLFEVLNQSTPSSKSPKPQKIGGIDISNSGLTPLRMPLIRASLTPRDKSLTPRQQIDNAKEKVRERETARISEASVAQIELQKLSDSEELDYCGKLLTLLSQKLYNSATSKIGLDIFLRDAQKMMGTLSHQKIESVLRRLQEFKPNWLRIEPSKFSRSTVILSVDSSVPPSEIQKLIRSKQDLAKN
jgi:DNA replication factor CDT1 like